MKSAHRGPIADNGIEVPALLSASCGTGPTWVVMNTVVSKQADGWVGERVSGGVAQREVAVVVALVYPHGPADAGELVGNADGGFVVTDAGL